VAIESVLVPVATGVLGIAIGLGASLVAKHKGRQMPKEDKRDAWEHMKALTHERAEAAAKKKALHRAYAAGSVNEHSFVTKDAYYTKHIEEFDKDIDFAVAELSKAFLPAEMEKGDKKLREISDIALMSKQLEDLKQEKRALDHEKSQLYLQMNEMEDDKRFQLKERNRLREKYDRDSKRLEEMASAIETLDKQRTELEKRVEGIRPRDQKIESLEHENKTLRESLGNARKKIHDSEKVQGVLTTIIDRAPLQGRKKSELPELVQPGNHGVKALAKAHATPEAAFAYVRDSITEVHPKIAASQWLTVDDTLRLGAADPHDKAVLLCSILRSQGRDAWVAVLEMRNGYQRAVVLLDDVLLDPAPGRAYRDYTGLSADEAVANYMFDGFAVKRVLYKFNDSRSV